MSLLEIERGEFEELEAIESAIADRLQRNPGLFVGSTSGVDHGILNVNKKRPSKEVFIQRHEIDYFIKRYKTKATALQESINSDAKKNLVEKLKVDNQKAFDFSLFDEKFNEIVSSNSTAGKVDTVMSLYKIGSASSTGKDNAVLRSQRDSPVPSLPAIPSESETPEEQSKKSILSRIAAHIDIDSIFSLEEQYGKYLDLIGFHEAWLNLPGLKDKHRLTYLQYLGIFSKVGLKYQQDENNPNSNLQRNSEEYSNYLKQLAEYLVAYIKKTQVLSGPERVLQKIENVDFAAEWESLLSKYINKPDEEKDDKLFCKACNKQFAKETVYNAHLSGKKHIKNAQKLENGNTSTNVDLDKERKLCLNEFLVRTLAELSEKQIKDTKLNVERKQALTNKERIEETNQLLELASKLYFTDDSEDDTENHDNKDGQDEEDDEYAYDNPLKLPLDLDGRPIPYWLWKLQGLDHEYECEVCGSFKYSGRKIFERHFMEQRHIHGLKCLGVNFGASKQGVSSSELLLSFKGITKIEEATRLWEKLKKEMRKVNHGNENIVEVEDEEGNVMSEKVYEDLKKQGLL